MPCRTVRPLQLAELHSDREKWKQAIFDVLIERRWGSPMSTPNKDDVNITTDTGNNEVDNDETAMSKRHMEIEDLVDS